MIERDLLLRFARRYVWWKTPEEAASMPERVIAQVMNIGDSADVQDLVDAAGVELLRAVLRHAEAGEFDERSWAYWHLRLKLADLAHIPPMPVRHVGCSRHSNPILTSSPGAKATVESTGPRTEAWLRVSWRHRHCVATWAPPLRR